MTTLLTENYILNPLLDIQGYKELKKTLHNKEDDLSEPIVKKIKKGKLFLLKGRTKSLLINDSIKTFLTLFKNATSLETASQSFAQTYHTSKEKVLPTLDKFLYDMRYQGIIVGLEEYQELLQLKEDSSQQERLPVFPIGSTVQQYRIVDLIAFKPKFDIYLAHNLKNQQTVVLKTLYFPEEENKWEKKEKNIILRQEFQLLNEVSGHPNICQYLDFYKNGKQAFGVMEYIKGWTLKSYLKKQQPNLQQKILLIQQLFDALAHVHKCGIVHGDIHKSNFLINEQHQIKLFDFDLANHHKLRKKELERRGGVFKYFPPEKIRKNCFEFMKAKADYRSEVYQIAIVAYYILYGQLPFKALTWRQLAKKIKKELPVFTVHTPKQETIPSVFIQLLKRSLSKQPTNRYKSAKVLAKKWKQAQMVISAKRVL